MHGYAALARFSYSLQGYGMTHHADLFTNRQLTALTTFSDLVMEARAKLMTDGADAPYADAVATYLAFVLSRLADLANNLCAWEPIAECPRHLFGLQAIPMKWDHAEGNPLGDSSGGWTVLLEGANRAFESPAFWSSGPIATAGQMDAVSRSSEQANMITTDPPYYDNVGYADLADFFYVWLRRSLSEIYPQLLSTVLTPKAAELVADPFRSDGDKRKAEHFFEENFERAFANLRAVSHPEYPLAIFYAFKQAESDTAGVASTGWETMLGGLLRAGLMVTATWPVRTEASNRIRNQASNALATSIVLACRPRAIDAGITDRRGFLAALLAELPEQLRHLQQSNIAPVDLAQAAIGPGMAVFSRYARVVEPSGETMGVRTALTLINQALDEVLAEQDGEFDADTRFCIKWFETYGFDEAAYDPAEGLARALNVSVKGLEEAGVLTAKAGRVRLLARDELDSGWDPTTDARMPIWEVTQHLVKALIDGGGEQAAAELLRKLGGLGQVARDLAYRLYTVAERRGWAEDAYGFNELVIAWPEITRRASLRGQGSLMSTGQDS